MLRVLSFAPVVPALFGLAAVWRKAGWFVGSARLGVRRPLACLAWGGALAALATLAAFGLMQVIMGGVDTALRGLAVYLAGAGLAAVISACAVASAGGLLAIGGRIGMDMETNAYGALLLGFVIVTLASAVPYLGSAAQFAAVSWGAGAFLLRLRERRASPPAIGKASVLAAVLLSLPLASRAASSQAALNARIVSVSARFLGVPYKRGPLGEGPDGEFDRNPIVRYDAFDCTTFVETTMALALEPDKAKAEDLLQRIRYKDGVVEYSFRNHFVSVDWIPNNVKAGFIKDITRDVAGSRTRLAAKTVSKKAWYAAKSVNDLVGRDDLTDNEKQTLVGIWRRVGDGMPDQQASLPYLPIDALPRFLNKIPSGTIANLVRADEPDKPVLVSHQVFLIDKDGKKFVREAAEGKDVRDVPALDYFKTYEGSKWPLLGLNLDAVSKP